MHHGPRRMRLHLTKIVNPGDNSQRRQWPWPTYITHTASGSSIGGMPCYICGSWPLPPLASVTWVVDGQVELPLPGTVMHAPPVPLWIWCDRWERQWGEGWACLCNLVCPRTWELQQDVRQRRAAAGGS